MARNYKKLEVWKLSYNLCLKFYKLTENFPEEEKENLISQIKRAATSIPLNIAEGCTRFSKRAFLQFLGYAYGSARELEVLLMLSKDLGYIDILQYNELFDEVDKTSKKLFLFIKSVEKSKFYNWFD